LLLIEVELFRRIWGYPPVSIVMHIFEPTFKISCLLHDYLSEKKGLENTILRITRNLLINSVGMLLHYDSILEVMEECKGLEIINAFDADERFIPVGCGNDKEREILWEAGNKNYDEADTLSKVLEPSLFIEEINRELGESGVFAGS
jgi:hypothetical protein